MEWGGTHIEERIFLLECERNLRDDAIKAFVTVRMAGLVSGRGRFSTGRLATI